MTVYKNHDQTRKPTNWPVLDWLKEIAIGDAATKAVVDPIRLPVMTAPQPGKLQVLVVDDEPVNLKMASDLLSGWGITPQFATDGAQAVALAGAQQFNLILMDLQMPILDGLGAAKQIRHREHELASDRAAIVAYTSMSPGESLLQACGFDGVLAKPCDLMALQDCLTQWCVPGANATASFSRTGSLCRSTGV